MPPTRSRRPCRTTPRSPVAAAGSPSGAGASARRTGAQDDWIHAADLPAASARLDGLGRRVFLTVGARSLGPFADAPGRFWLVRSIDPPEPPPAFDDWRLITARGPFTVADETELLAHHAIDVLVTKNSGAPAMRAKLDAARQRRA